MQLLPMQSAFGGRYNALKVVSESEFNPNGSVVEPMYYLISQYFSHSSVFYADVAVY